MSSNDPFREDRAKSPVKVCRFQGEDVPMILRHEDVRQAAKDWRTFSSDAPRRVPIPSEENVRTMRQLPLEVDPPDHTDYREIVEPVFRRAKDPAVIGEIESLTERLVDEASGKESIEAVRGFAVPLQSYALAHLLNMPESEAEVWIGWGVHVFRDGPNGEQKGAALEVYQHQQFDRAEAEPGEDFFSLLTRASFRGRRLTRDEMMGYANIVFAGGRDTIIHTVTSALAYLGNRPEALEYLRQDVSRVTLASEEFFRVFMPLTHIGRVCPVRTDVHGHVVEPRGRVSLGWVSANHDEGVFDAPDEIRLDRKPNPHLSFGFGAHICLGAPHARLLIRTLLRKCAQNLERIVILDAVDRVEHEESFQRTAGYDSLVLRLVPRVRPDSEK